MAEPRWLDPREQQAWRAFLRAHAQLQRRLTQQLRIETGLSGPDYEVLVNLSEAPDHRLRAFELGEATQWEKSRLSHHLTRMEARGLVRRETCRTDSRGAFIVLTDVGEATIAEAAPRHVAHVRRWLVDVLSPEQLDVLEQISSVVLANLSTDDPALDCPDGGAGIGDGCDDDDDEGCPGGGR